MMRRYGGTLHGYSWDMEIHMKLKYQIQNDIGSLPILKYSVVIDYQMHACTHTCADILKEKSDLGHCFSHSTQPEYLNILNFGWLHFLE